MSDLFDNAIDSLEFGIRVYLYGEYETAHKHAILNVFHSDSFQELYERLGQDEYLAENVFFVPKDACLDTAPG